MDESFHEFETELKKLHAHRLSSRLIGDVGTELSITLEEKAVETGSRENAAFASNTWRWLSWRGAGLAVAAAVALTTVALLKPSRAHAPAEVARPSIASSKSQPIAHTQASIPVVDDRYQPVAVANVLYDLQDEGQVTIEGNTSMRQVRYRYLDTYTWKNPRSNASLKWSVPRDEIRVLPVSFN
jgi:hypothetical protein